MPMRASNRILHTLRELSENFLASSIAGLLDSLIAGGGTILKKR
jgi:hypothetical protein